VSRRPRVLVVWRSLPHYRVPFFSLLRERLDEQGIDLRLVVGQPSRREAVRRDQGALEWAVTKRNRVVALAGREAIVQPVLREAQAADLVIVEQANRLLANYALLALQRFGARVGFWGHGANLQARRPRSPAERLKRVVSRRPHWWFAYTDGCRDRVAGLGFPHERITVVQNAQDTELLAAAVRATTPDRVRAFRERHSLGTGPLGVFLGSLYPDKRLDLLLAAGEDVAARIPGFRLAIAGDGEERDLALAAARSRPWVRYLGRLEARAELLAAADALLLPGAVGLVVLDAFAAGVPLVTAASPYHGPEIEYLEHGVNGVVADGGTYADAVVRLLTDASWAARLREGCASAAGRYTVAAMVDRFAIGVRQALAA
jgi:glycosyltransferase involved in cell wall biosynthesis